jgi:hypothetical protein
MITDAEEEEKEECVQRAVRRAAMILCDSALSYQDPDEDVEVAYRFDFQVALKGGRPWHERGLHQKFSSSLNERDGLRRSDGLPLFSDFPAADDGWDHGTTYRIRVGVYKQRNRRNNSAFGDHTEHVPVWSDYLVLTLMPNSGAANYSWASESAASFREAATMLSVDGIEVIIPVPGRAYGALGTKASLRFQVASSR